MDNNKQDKYVQLIPIFIIIFLCSFWVACHPLSRECAKKSFYSYLEEYAIPVDNIASISISKPYTFSYTRISVKYIDEPELTYRYNYDIISCVFINEPKYIVLEYDVFGISKEEAEELYGKPKYPLISQESKSS